MKTQEEREEQRSRNALLIYRYLSGGRKSDDLERLLSENKSLINKALAKCGELDSTTRADLYAQGLVILKKVIENYNPSKGELSTYAIKSIHCNFLTSLRKRRKILEVESSLEESNDEGLGAYSDKLADSKQSIGFELVEIIELLKQSLNPQESQLMTLLFIDRLTVNETASAMGITVGQVVATKRRALKKLRKALDP